MKVIKARIDGQLFFLTADHDVEALKQRIVTAIREGSDFVEFDTIGRESISVLITPNLPVRFEILERSEEQVEEWERTPPPIDASDLNAYFEDYPELLG